MSCAKGHQAKQKGMGDLSPGLNHKVSIYIFQPRNFRKFVFTLQRQQCLLTYRTEEKKEKEKERKMDTSATNYLISETNSRVII